MNNGAWQLEMARPLCWAALLVLAPVLVYWWRHTLVRFSPRQRNASLAVRGLLLVLLLAAISGIRVKTNSRQQFVLFAVDQSHSISDAARQRAEDVLSKARAARGEHRIAVLPFADRPGSVSAALPSPLKSPPPGTDLAAMLLEAEMAMPAEYVSQIVVLTDGNETSGDALSSAQGSAVPISVIPLPGRPQREVWISGVRCPTRVREGVSFSIEVVIQSTHANRGVLRLSVGSEVIAQQDSRVIVGETSCTFSQVVVGRPETQFTMELVGFQDELSENNLASGAVSSSGNVRVLLIAGDPTVAEPLATALRSESIDVKVASADRDDDWADLTHYDTIVLDNVPATALPNNSVEALWQYVSAHGGGLLTIGGDRVFTPGGYRDTRLEELLPLTSDVRRDKPKPSLAMVLVIDQSFSMGQQRKIELARQAARGVVETLRPTDQIGVLAFEDDSQWISPLGPCDDKARLLGEINKIEAGGGTEMYSAMAKAYLALDEAYAQRKHMIVLTDGISHPGEFDQLTREMAAAGITVSTVGVGEEVARPLLADIARTSGGRFYDCRNPADVPKVFALEAMSAGRLGISEGAFSAKAVDAEGVFGGFDFDTAPTLLGYLETRLRPTAKTILSTSDGEPLLAEWQVGCGRSIAFTSDAQDRWAAAWLRWDGFSRFWAQTVRHAMRRSSETAPTDWEIGYHREFAVLPTNTEFLRAITELSGGQYDPKPADIFTPSSRTVTRTTLLWPYLLAAAVMLFVIDVALKRVELAAPSCPINTQP